MKSAALIQALSKKFGQTTDKALSQILGITPQTLSNWRNGGEIQPMQVARLALRLTNRAVAGEQLVAALKKKLGGSEGEVAAKIGRSPALVSRLKRERTVSAKQIAALVKSSRDASRSEAEKTSVRPLVEFYPLAKSRKGKAHSLFTTGEDHPYLVGLKDELSLHHGVYIFFDSRGQAIYVGKARKQDLWKEMNLAFNRDRDDLQTILRPSHPATTKKYKSLDEKSRQIYARKVALHELAHYVSAYHVTDGMVNDVEALLVRSFANNLLNKRIEKFSAHRSPKKKRASAGRRRKPRSVTKS